MNRRRPAAFAYVVLGLVLALAACSRHEAPTTPEAQEPPPSETAEVPHPMVIAEKCAPTVRNAWVRLVPGGDMPMDAGYAVIDNACSTPAVIIGATSPSYADVSVHESTMADGMSRMRPVDTLRIEPNGHVELKPGGYHLMLMAPRMRPRAGQRVTILFQLQDGRTTAGSFEAKPAVAP